MKKYLSVDQLLQQQEYVQALKDRVRKVCCRYVLDRDDLDDITGQLIVELKNPRWQEPLGSQNRNSVIDKLARGCSKKHFANRMLTAYSFDPTQDAIPGQHAPSQWLSHIELGEIETAPYRAEFISSTVQHGLYERNPFYIPEFEIVPANFVGRRVGPSGRRRSKLQESELNSSEACALWLHRENYTHAIRRAIHGFMHWYGRNTLPPKERRIVELVNKEGLSKETARDRANLPYSTFTDCWARIERRGYRLEKDEKTELFSFSYNPPLDTSWKPLDPRSLERILATPLEELMTSDNFLYYATFEDDRYGAQSLVTAYRDRINELLLATMDMDRIDAYDAHLRVLITTLVERPFSADKTMTMRQMDEFIAEIGLDRLQQLLFLSLRTRKPISGLITLGDLVRNENTAHWEFRKRRAS